MQNKIKKIHPKMIGMPSVDKEHKDHKKHP